MVGYRYGHYQLTTANLHQNNASRLGCQACAHRDEDCSHILRCPHSNRNDLRTSMLASFRKVCDKWNTRPPVKTILLDGIQGWLASQIRRPTISIQTITMQRNSTILSINKIKLDGNRFFLGWFIWEWSDKQDAYYVTRPNYNPKKCRKGSAWQVAIIRCLWDQWYLLWEIRNKDLHGEDARQSAIIERRNAPQTLRELYELRNHYEPSARDLLMKYIRDHEARSTWRIKTWLALTESVLQASYKEQGN